MHALMALFFIVIQNAKTKTNIIKKCCRKKQKKMQNSLQGREGSRSVRTASLINVFKHIHLSRIIMEKTM
jgi:hypothetical protein